MKFPETLASGFRSWAASGSKDLGGRSWALSVWSMGVILATAGFFLPNARAIFWSVAFGTSGLLCLANAVRARRFHCALTGPILLIGAGLTLFRVFDVLHVDWNWIGGGVSAGVLAALILEALLGTKRIGVECCGLNHRAATRTRTP